MERKLGQSDIELARIFLAGESGAISERMDQEAVRAREGEIARVEACAGRCAAFLGSVSDKAVNAAVLRYGRAVENAGKYAGDKVLSAWLVKNAKTELQVALAIRGIGNAALSDIMDAADYFSRTYR